MVEAKEFLKQPERLDLRIKNKLIEKQQWRDIALGITSGSESIWIERNGKKELHNMEKVQSSGSQSKMAEAVIKCVDMESEIDSLVDELIDTKKKVIQTIEQLDSATEYNVLHMRYIQYLSLQDIADHYNRDYGWATTTHGRALKSVQNILDESM